jgi:hypothetical protein
MTLIFNPLHRRIPANSSLWVIPFTILWNPATLTFIVR